MESFRQLDDMMLSQLYLVELAMRVKEAKSQMPQAQVRTACSCCPRDALRPPSGLSGCGFAMMPLDIQCRGHAASLAFLQGFRRWVLCAHVGGAS